MKTKTTTLGVLLLALLGACASVDTSSGAGENTWKGNEASDKFDVVEDNVQLRSYFTIREIRSQRRDGRLAIQFELVNKYRTTRTVEWQIEWFDASGFSVGRSDNWNRETIAGNGSKALSTTALKPEATGWAMHVRPPYNSR